MAETILDRVQADTREAMKAGERELVSTLRMVTDALQREHKEAGDEQSVDEIAVLRRERKRRIEAADAYRDGGSAERATAEETEAEVIERYLPAELSDAELAELVATAVERTGADGARDIGKVMGAVMPTVDGRADGARVSAAVRERLGS